MARTQAELPFSEAAGVWAERRNLLGLALMRIGCDAELSIFARWVFDTTQGGATGALKKTYDELAAAPYGMCCSYSKARRTVSRARSAGLVVVQENLYSSSGQSANSYQINWDGVRRILGLRTRAEGHQGPDGAAQGEQGAAQGEQGAAQGEQAYRKYPLDNLFEEPVPDRGPVPPPPFQNGGNGGGSGAVLVAAPKTAVSVPEFWAEARSRMVEPLPASEEFACGIFRPLKRDHLEQIGLLITWFRRQLSALEPATGNSEADLLLVLAAAGYARGLRDASVKSSRVGIFIDAVRHNRVEKCRPWLPDARRALDREIARFGREALLCGKAWPPRPLAAGQEDDEPP